MSHRACLGSKTRLSLVPQAQVRTLFLIHSGISALRKPGTVSPSQGEVSCWRCSTPGLRAYRTSFKDASLLLLVDIIVWVQPTWTRQAVGSTILVGTAPRSLEF